MTAKVADKKWNNEDKMKTTIRTVCVALAVAALCGCGVPKEEHQKVQDDLAAAKSQLARAQQDIQALKGALDQKDAEASNMAQDFQKQKASYEGIMKKQRDMLEAANKGKSTTAAPKATTPTTKAKTTSKAPAKAPAKKAAAH